MKGDVLAALVDEIQSMRNFDSSRLYQAFLSRKFALIFSPTVKIDLITPMTTNGTLPFSTIRSMGEDNFVAVVDFIAQIIREAVISHYDLKKIQIEEFMDTLASAPIDNQEASKRFACFVAADGANDWVQLTYGQKKLLRFVDGSRYFNGNVSFSPLDIQKAYADAQEISIQWKHCQGGYEPVDSEPVKDPPMVRNAQQFKDYLMDYSSSNLQKKSNEVRPHKLAYFLLVHKRVENVMTLIEALVDPFVTILIHVDLKSPDLKKRLQKFIRVNAKRNENYRRIRVMEQSFEGLWGSSSLVFSQLQGFFELMDMNSDWEYVVNLSGNDYPLRTNDVIYNDLKVYGRSSFIGHWTSFDAVTRVNDYPSMPSVDKFMGQPSGLSFKKSPSTSVSINGNDYPPERLNAVLEILGTNKLGKLQFPFSHWPLYKHHQWMILDVDFVRKLRSSPVAMYVAAFMEWTVIPDESYFATVAKNVPSISPIIINDSKRFLEFPVGASHPRWITEYDLPTLFDKVIEGKAFTRKLDMGRSDSWALVRGIEKLRIWDWNRIFAPNTSLS